MRKAETAANRPSKAVSLVAVSKVQPWAAVEPVLKAGHRVFGENRVQEAQSRWMPVRSDYPDLSLHLIGPLQSNKAAEAVAMFDVIETLDREKIARAIAEEIQKQGRAPRLYIQVNTGEEPQKAGIAPAELEAFMALVRGPYGLEPEGLMCIPPFDQVPAPHFALLAKLAGRVGVDKLSMGMSSDYEIAIAYGATSVRVGSALFGSRIPAEA